MPGWRAAAEGCRGRTGVVMDSHSPALFVGDALGLDFLNSVATPQDTTIDWIDDGEGLLRWLDQARLVPASALDAIRAQALPGELDKVADRARSLRERSEEHTSELQSLMRISYAVFCLKTKKKTILCKPQTYKS